MSLATAPDMLSPGVRADQPPLYADTALGTASQGNVCTIQTPAFCLHRCRHRGIELGDEERSLELPSGLTEVLKHMHGTPQEVRLKSHTAYDEG
jgi:hypothetical protein